MTDKNISQLLNKGRTGLIKGFVSKSGKKFNAYLVIDSESKEIKFDFLSDRECEMVCPICHMRQAYEKVKIRLYLLRFQQGRKRL